MSAAHERTVDAALDANEEMLRLFRLIGSADDPDGRILAAYRDARMVLDNPAALENRALVANVLARLRREIEAEAGSLIDAGLDLGAAQARTQLRAYGLLAGQAPRALRDEIRDALVGAVAGLVVVQAARAATAALSGAAPEELVGDGTRMGILSPGEVMISARDAIARASYGAYDYAVAETTQASGERWFKQVVAAIDERTTDCCLQLHGVAVPMDEDFDVEGEPRYADQQAGPPFHWGCRSALALVTEADVADDLTGRMQGAARAEISSRERGEGVTTAPSNALRGG